MPAKLKTGISCDLVLHIRDVVHLSIDQSNIHAKLHLITSPSDKELALGRSRIVVLQQQFVRTIQ